MSAHLGYWRHNNQPVGVPDQLEEKGEGWVDPACLAVQSVPFLSSSTLLYFPEAMSYAVFGIVRLRIKARDYLVP